MIYGLNLDITRYILRKVRKEEKLRQIDLADSKVSYGTISNIERGIGHVDEQTIYRYLSKLGLTKKMLKQLVSKELERIDNLTFFLESAEALIDVNKYEEAEEMLKESPLDRFHPLAPYYTYLEGRILREKGNFKKAEQCYFLAIRLINQYNLRYRSNVSATCYNALGVLSYKQNKLEDAISYTDKGIAEVDGSKENGIMYTLISNKILYLLKSSQYDAAKQTLDEIWHHISDIDNTSVLLNIYKSKATILSKMRKYEEAVEVCKNGISIAMRNHIPVRYLDLIVVLGSIYLSQEQVKSAKQCFETVLRYDREVNYPRSHVDALSSLAVISMQEGNYDEAKKKVELAADIARKFSQFYGLAKALVIGGNLSVAQSRFQEASHFYSEAEQIAEKHGFKERQYEALLLLADCFDNMNLEEEWKRTAKKLLNLQQNLHGEGGIYGIYRC